MYFCFNNVVFFKDSFPVTVGECVRCISVVLLSIRIEQTQSNKSQGPFINLFTSQYVWRGSNEGIEFAQWAWLWPYIWNLRKVGLSVWKAKSESVLTPKRLSHSTVFCWLVFASEVFPALGLCTLLGTGCG